MSVDVNGYFGRWPVRTPGIWDPTDYLRKMDSFDIEYALLTSTEALLDHTERGNANLAAVIRAYPDRFLGAGVINPLPGPDRAVSEVRRCLDQGFRAFRLYPALHSYTAAEYALLEPAMEEAYHARAPILITLRVTAHSGFPETPLSLVRALATHYPDNTFIVCGAGPAERLMLSRYAAAHSNLFVEISQMTGANAVQHFSDLLGSARILLGTGMGVFYASPALRRVATAAVADADRAAILTGNAQRLLHLRG